MRYGFPTKDAALKSAQRIAQLANEGRDWKTLQTITGIHFDLIPPQTISPDQVSSIAYLTTIDGVDIYITSRTKNGPWQAFAGGTRIAAHLKTSPQEHIQRFVSRRQATITAQKFCNAANRDTPLDEIRDKLDIPFRLYEPKTLSQRQIERIAFLGVLLDGTEVIALQSPQTLQWNFEYFE